MSYFRDGSVVYTIGDILSMVDKIANLEREKAELVAQVEYVKSHFNDLIEVAQRCDSWESFPQKPLDRAVTALESMPVNCLNQIKAEAVSDFVEMVDNEFSTTELCAHYGSRGTDASDLTEKQVVLTVDLKQAKLQHAASIAKGE